MKSEGNIKVFCRFRPFNSAELAANPTLLHRIAKGSQLTIKDTKAESVFIYDQVFDLLSTQEEVFERVGEPVLNNILDGFHGTIMAYGQTSSGKTHTMQGYEASEGGKGIIPRMVSSQLYRSSGFSWPSRSPPRTSSSS
jgi:kinesin family member 5